MIHTLLEPLFQPIIDRDGNVYAYEALMRLRGGAEVSPASMVKRWEQTGFIKMADLAMLRRIAEQLAASGTRPRIAVNVSIATVEAAGDEYMQALIELAPHARRLIVELTETAAVTNAAALRSFHRACTLNRFIVALDDCRPGHPYGTRAFIDNFRPHLIKIDGEYLQQCHQDGQLAAIRELIEAAHRRDARVIAEYVSTLELQEFAFYLGADYVQGFVLGRPAPLLSLHGSVYTHPIVINV